MLEFKKFEIKKLKFIERNNLKRLELKIRLFKKV